MVRSGRQRHISGAEATTGPNQGFAFAEIHAGLTQIVAGRSRDRKPDPLILALNILLNDDGIGAGRHRRAGEDTHRLARADRSFESAAGGGFADHRQCRRRRRRIGRT